MSSRNLSQELSVLDQEIGRLELRRTTIVIMMELAAMPPEPSSNVIRFPRPSSITTSRPASDDWPTAVILSAEAPGDAE
jgi:hypothetical protein